MKARPMAPGTSGEAAGRFPAPLATQAFRERLRAAQAANELAARNERGNRSLPRGRAVPASTGMTENEKTSTATGDWQTHQQPCFCDHCWPVTIEGLIGERAVILQAALADRLYADGLESGMADEIIAAIPPARRLDVLTYMLTWDHLHPRVMAVDCLLDECDTRSYKALEEMAAILLAAIRAQGGEGGALRGLIVNEICNPITAELHSNAELQTRRT